jgi:hypothetical protein
MDALTRCKAMEAFCRQRAQMEGEVAGFWLSEAEIWRDRLVALASQARPAPKRLRDPSSAKTASRTRRAAQ